MVCFRLEQYLSFRDYILQRPVHSLQVVLEASLIAEYNVKKQGVEARGRM